MTEEKNKEEEKILSTEEMLKKSLQWSQIIYEQNRKIKRRLDLMLWGGVLKWLLILLPLVLALIYLPPLFKDLMGQYGALLNGASKSGVSNGGININQILGNLSQEEIGSILKMIQR